MCGRFTLTTADYNAVAEALEAELLADDAEAYRPRYNVAPGDVHWIVTVDEHGVRRMLPATWGMLEPPKPDARPIMHINARSETAHARPLFRDAFASARCVIPADGFYEWTGPKENRLPIWYHPPAGVIALAGLFDEHVDPETGEIQLRFVILTSAANDLVSPVHDRMPVILPPAALQTWLARRSGRLPDDTRQELRALLHPAPSDLLVATEVSSRANKVAHDDPACIEPTAHPRQSTLF